MKMLTFVPLLGVLLAGCAFSMGQDYPLVYSAAVVDDVVVRYESYIPSGGESSRTRIAVYDRETSEMIKEINEWSFKCEFDSPMRLDAFDGILVMNWICPMGVVGEGAHYAYDVSSGDINDLARVPHNGEITVTRNVESVDQCFSINATGVDRVIDLTEMIYDQGISRIIESGCLPTNIIASFPSLQSGGYIWFLLQDRDSFGDDQPSDGSELCFIEVDTNQATCKSIPFGSGASAVSVFDGSTVAIALDGGDSADRSPGYVIDLDDGLVCEFSFPGRVENLVSGEPYGDLAFLGIDREISLLSRDEIAGQISCS